MSANENFETTTSTKQTRTGRRSAGHARRRFLGVAAAAAVVAGVLGGSVLASGTPASAASTTGWLMGAGTLAGVATQDPATASQMLNTPNAFGTGASMTGNPIMPGLKATPVLTYTSYAQFSSDFGNARVNFPYKWVIYDPEEWSQTPVNEQQDPVKYMTLFGQLAHIYGLKVIMAPALDLAYVPGSVTPRLPGESGPAWFIRAGLAGAAAAAGDIVNVQNESQTTNLPMYDWMYNSAAAQARTANPSARVFGEVSTVNGTPQQMATAAQSITADGYYVAAPGATSQAVQFFQAMKAAGY